MKYSEYEEQKQLIKWWRELKHYKFVPQHYHLICTDTSAKRTIGQQIRYKAMGGEPGTADLFLAVPNDIYNGVWIELKSPDRKPKTDKGEGGVSFEQLAFLNDIMKLGYLDAVCYSATEAQKLISDYLGIKL